MLQPGQPAGDVVFVLKQKPHLVFERSGADLLTTVTITLSEALLGFSRIMLTHLDGRGIKVTSPPMKVIKPNHTIVLRGEGMPTYKRPDHKGDLYVGLEIEMPDESWARSVDKAVRFLVPDDYVRDLTYISPQALRPLLPPKREDVSPLPAIVDEVDYEEADIEEVRERSFPAGANFFDGVFGQFGDGADDEEEEDWEDEEEDDHNFGFHPAGEPECRPQ